MTRPPNRLKLHGFNNLTKTLSFNIYDLAFAQNLRQHQAYIEHIDSVYNAERLTRILTDVADIIGASVLNVAHQDYDPRGASVAVLVAEEPLKGQGPASGPARTLSSETVLAHLDKSHLTAHTYPETHPEGGLSSFRVDIDASTCGGVSPLSALHYLIDSFESDILIIDYRVRGFTRDVAGRKLFMDHDIDSVQDYLAPDTLRRYQAVDVNLPRENLFHTRLMVKDFQLNDYLYGASNKDLSAREKEAVQRLVRRELREIFHGKNL